MTKAWVFGLVLVLTGAAASADVSVQRNGVAVALNPIEAVLGLVNFEIEYAFLPRFSLSLFGEYLLTDRTFSRDEHPDLTVRIESRFYLLGTGLTSGLYVGPHVGYTRCAVLPPHSDLFFGVESGYRLPFAGIFFVAPRGILSYAVGQTRFVPGFEVLAGFLF